MRFEDKIYGVLRQRAEQRQVDIAPRRRRKSWLLASGAAGAALVTGAGVAFAVWSTSGSGSGASKAATLVISVSGTAPTTGGSSVHPLSVPGGSSGTSGGDLNVTITNNNGYTVYVDSIQQNGLVTVSGASGTCPSDSGTFPSSVTQGSFAYAGGYAAGTPPTYSSYTLPAPIAVPSSASPQTVTITNVVGMTNSSPTGCQGAILTIPVSVTLGTS